VFQKMHRFHHSIFIKLLFILLLIGFIILIAVSIFYKSIMGDRFETMMQNNIENYAQYIAADIGTPPDTLRAKAIARQFFLDIRFESPTLTWATSPGLPAIKDIDEDAFFLFKTRPGMGWMKHSYYIITNADGSQFLITPNFGSSTGYHHLFFLSLLLLIAIVFLLTYFLIRHVLRPIRWLDSGVKKIGLGDLSHHIQEGKKDELGDLTRAFNTMTRRIREMLHARDQLLIDVSHELRSPITRIRVALEFLPDSKNKIHINNDINEIEMMITELLESERLNGKYGQLILEKTDLVKLVREITNTFGSCLPGIALHLPDGPVTIPIDQKRMHIAIKNVLDNACKYAQKDSKPVEIYLEKTADHIILTIRDDGIGIPKEELSYLFEPFYRVDRSRSKKSGGYGLGLSLCRKIIEAHGGTINITNNPGRGVKVIVTLNCKSENG
jgi:signal transduction histidine kinase